MAITHFSGPIGLGSASLETITAAKTLVGKDDNGKTFMLNAATGFTVTLPAHAAGLRFKFVVGAVFATDNFIVLANSADLDTMEGSVIVAGAVVTVNAADQINFVATAENIGDFAEFLSDGTTWHVFGNALSSGGITATG